MVWVSDDPAVPRPDHAGENAQLVALHHHLHTLGVTLVVSPPTDAAAVVDLVVDLLDRVNHLIPALTRVAPAVLVTFGHLDKATAIGLLCSEVTEAHRQLGNGLRDHHIDLGRPQIEIRNLVSKSLDDGSLARLQLETGNTLPGDADQQSLE